MSTRVILLLAMLATSVLVGCDAGTSHGERNPVEYDLRAAADAARSGKVADADEVRRILSLDPRQMMGALNELGVRSTDASAVAVLVAAWQGLRSAEPSLNWADLDRSDVRLALASELVRSHINGAVDVPIESIAEFGRAHLHSQVDEGTLNRAMYLVVLAGGAQDITDVKKILLTTSSQTTFRAGVSALFSTCSSDAARAIDEIRSRSTDQVHKAIVDEVEAKSAAFRAARCDRQTG
jgi:hypothetical protein